MRAFTASPPVASSQVYRDPNHRFTFTRPALWTLTPRSDGVLLTDGDGVNSMTLTIGAPSSGEDAKAAADALAKSQNLAAAPQQQFAGTTWEVRSGPHTDADGVTRQTTLYVTLHDGQSIASRARVRWPAIAPPTTWSTNRCWPPSPSGRAWCPDPERSI